MLLVLLLLPFIQATVGAVVQDDVRHALTVQSHVNLFVAMHDHAFPATALNSTIRSERIAQFVAHSKRLANESQAHVRQLLETLQSSAPSQYFASFTSFWLTNQVFVERATAKLVEKLGEVPSVATIRLEQVLRADPSHGNQQVHRQLPQSINNEGNWALDRIQVPNVWSLGFKGDGIIVAQMDTGVRGNHDELKSNFRSKYGWLDAIDNKAEPFDAHGHGTQTLAAAVGQRFGVAPNAQWIACRACDRTLNCAQQHVAMCADFLTCPSAVDVEHPTRCPFAPHVILNAWAASSRLDWMQDMIGRWQAAGIVPVVANGNHGPDCGSVGSPADSNKVIAVGATTLDDGLWERSARGPGPSHVIKPDISAPGDAIPTASHASDSASIVVSGTSVAASYVAGTVALMLQADKTLNFYQVYDRLTRTAEQQSLDRPSQTCGSVGFPNNDYGYGRLNALAAVTAQFPTTSGCEAIRRPVDCELDPNCEWVEEQCISK